MERERDLVVALRAELAAIEPARACCRMSERAGLGVAATGHARSPAVARLAVRLEQGHGRHRAMDPVTPEGGPFDWDAAADHCRISWLRGRFLAHGSLSLAPSSTHLEFVVPIDEAEAMAAHLAEIGLPASWRVRRGRGVVTWKDQERMLTFLRRAGASAAALELESRGVTRTLHGHLNRVLNAESANLRRSVAAAGRQLAAIDVLDATGELGRMSAFDRSVARARRDGPEETLAELAERLDVSRSRVQRSLGRMEAAAARESRARATATVG